MTNDPLFRQLDATKEIYSVLEKGSLSLVEELLKTVRAALDARNLENVEPAREILTKVKSASAAAKSHALWESQTQPVTVLAEITDAVKERLKQLVRFTEADVAHLLMLEPDGENLRIVIDTRDTKDDENRTIPIDGSVTGRAFSTRQLQRVPDTTKDADYTPISGNKPMKSELASPLLDMRQTRALGVLNIESKHIEAFSEWDEKTLMLCANLASIFFLREDRSVSQWRELQPVLKAMLSVGEELPSLERILDMALEQGKRRIDSPAGFVALLEKEELVVWAPIAPQGKRLRLKISKSLAGQVIEGRALLDVQECKSIATIFTI